MVVVVVLVVVVLVCCFPLTKTNKDNKGCLLVSLGLRLLVCVCVVLIYIENRFSMISTSVGFVCFEVLFVFNGTFDYGLLKRCIIVCCFG